VGKGDESWQSAIISRPKGSREKRGKSIEERKRKKIFRCAKQISKTLKASRHSIKSKKKKPEAGRRDGRRGTSVKPLEFKNKKF